MSIGLIIAYYIHSLSTVAKDFEIPLRRVSHRRFKANKSGYLLYKISYMPNLEGMKHLLVIGNA